MNDTAIPLPLISIVLVLVLLYSVISILKPLPPFKRRRQAFLCVSLASLAFVSLALTGSMTETPAEKTPPTVQLSGSESTGSKPETPTEEKPPEIQPSEIESIDSKPEIEILDEKIRCDIFDIKSQIQNDELLIFLNTDCPDYSEITISVYRVFYEVGTTNAYSRNYFQEKSTVGNWRTQRSISVAHANWLAELDAHRQEMKRFGSGFTVDRIGDNIEISVVLPINQADERFGHRNSNLVGKAVNASGLRVIERAVSIDYPLRETSEQEAPDVAAVIPSFNSKTLDLDRSYRISERTALVPELNPDDPTAALATTKYLETRSVIRITGVSAMHGSSWYNVDASDAAGGHVGTGWINSIALMGQNLEPLPAEDGTEGITLTTRAQRMLSELGYKPGPIDGVMGAKTASAVRAFQEANGMMVDGTVTDGLVDAMLALSAEPAAEVAPETVSDEGHDESATPACPTLDGDRLTEVAQWLDMGVTDDNIGSLFKITPACAKEWRAAVEG